MTRDAVLAAGREIIGESGVSALTMRSLARRLGVMPNTLYSHVDSKTHLLDELLDDVLASVAAPRDDDPDPLNAVARLMSSTYDVLTAHADLVPVFLERQGARGPNAVRLGEVMDRLLGRAGLRGQAITDARRVLIVHAVGFAAFAASSPGAPATAPPSEAASRRTFQRSLGWLLAGISTEPGDVSATASGITHDS